MNTDKSKEFTIKDMADKIANRRGKGVYLLGTNKRGSNVYYVGDYADASKAKWKYQDSTDKRSPKRKRSVGFN